MQRLSNLSNDALLQDLHRLVDLQRRATSDIVLHLAEVDARRLHAHQGFPSLFSYCVEELRFSEDEACRRIEAARLGRRFPAVLELLSTGAVTLTVLGLLKPHLTPDNHEELLAGVSRSSVRRAKEWLVTRFPKPDVPWSIRKLPELASAVPAFASPAVRTIPTTALPAPVRVHPAHVATPDRAAMQPAPAQVPLTHVPAVDRAAMPPAPPQVLLTHVPAVDRAAMPPAPPQVLPILVATPDPAVPPSLPASRRARIEPLSRDTFLVKLTARRALRDKLELARDLMSHANPEGDLAVVIERALDALLRELEKAKLGLAARSDRKSRPAKRTRVTNATRRDVVARDGLCCAFVAIDGRRCDARAFLEFDHAAPKGRGGDSGPENIRLLCRAHNLLAAEGVYGAAHMQRAISRTHREDRRRTKVPEAGRRDMGAEAGASVGKMAAGSRE